AKYGSDKPDLRFGLEIVDVSDIASQSGFGVFCSAVTSGGVVRALNAKGGASEDSNTKLRPGGELPRIAEQNKAEGLAWMKFEGDKFTGSIEKFFSDAIKQALKERLRVANGDLILFVADKEGVVSDALGALRTHLGTALKLFKNWWDEKAEFDEAE